MTDYEINFVKQCILDNDVHKFYTWTPWLNTRKRVLEMDRHECQICKANGKYSRAILVHHVNHLKQHPELALEVWYTDPVDETRNRQLISLCCDCHEAQHPERLKQNKNEKFTTEEKW